MDKNKESEEKREINNNIFNGFLTLVGLKNRK